MKWELIDNDLYIADRIKLEQKEKKLFRLLSTFTELSLDELCIALRLPTIFTINCINSFNKKMGFYMKIVRTRTDTSNRFRPYYKLKKRRGY